MGKDKDKSSKKESVLKNRVKELEKQNNWPDKIYKLCTLLGVPSLLVLIGVLYSQNEKVKENRVVTLVEKVEHLKQFEPSTLAGRLVTLQQNYDRILEDLEYKNKELRRILEINKIEYDSLRFVFNSNDPLYPKINALQFIFRAEAPVPISAEAPVPTSAKIPIIR